MMLLIEQDNEQNEVHANSRESSGLQFKNVKFTFWELLVTSSLYGRLIEETQGIKYRQQPHTLY
jgi:hypothetical protein